MNFLLRHAYLPLSLAIVVGCQSAEDKAPASAAVSATSASAPAAAQATAKPNSAAPHQPTLANANVTSAKVVDFKPPFPERADLFEAPKRAQSTVRRDDEHGQTVELKGFVNAGEPSAVLSIDGVLSSVPEGSEKYGVQVISIQPPKAVLQRGRSRWTATLE